MPRGTLHACIRVCVCACMHACRGVAWRCTVRVRACMHACISECARVCTRCACTCMGARKRTCERECIRTCVAACADAAPRSVRHGSRQPAPASFSLRNPSSCLVPKFLAWSRAYMKTGQSHTCVCMGVCIRSYMHACVAFEVVSEAAIVCLSATLRFVSHNDNTV